MTDDQPWWFSGHGAEQSEDRRHDPTAEGGAGFSFAGVRLGGLTLSNITAGAQQLVDLARHALVTPHAEHSDPREHGDCILCRALTLIAQTADPVDRGRNAVAWIDLDPPQPDDQRP